MTSKSTDRILSRDELDSWLFEHSPDCLKILDTEGRLLEMNWNGQCAMEIIDFQGICGALWSTLWPQENRALIESALAQARAGKIGRFNAFCPTAAGSPRWWDVTVAPIQERDGRVERLLSVSRDITAQHKAQEEQRETARRLRFMLEAAQVGEWDLDLETGKASTSLLHDRCYGYTEPLPEWTFDLFMRHVHPDDRNSVKAAFEAALSELRDWKFECRVTWSDRSVHWIGALGSIYRSSGGRPTRMVGTVIDITERKRAEALAAGQRSALEMAVAGAPLPQILDVLTRAAEAATGETVMASVLLFDADEGRLRHGSAPTLPAAYSAAIDGVSIGPAVGSCGTAAFLGRPVLTRDIETDPNWADFRGLAREHGLRSCWSQPILSNEGKVLGTLAAYRDDVWEPGPTERHTLALLLTTASLVLDRHQEALERKRAEENLRQLANELSEADRRKTEFLATLAHELRNPLAPIRSGLEVMLVAGHSPASVVRVRQMMERQVSHMSHLVDDLLDVARITSGKLELKKERVALKELVSTAVETSLPVIESSRHQLSTNFQEDALVLDADPTRIAQVISNLLNNAAKYTPPGGHISLSAERQGEQAVIAVSDTGIGLAGEVLPTVFEMFTQVRSDLHQGQGGLGIGLTLVRRLVELHGGTVEATSAGPGRGSTFRVRLPLAKDSAVPQPTAAASFAHAAGPEAERLRIMVVDDNQDAAETLAALMELGGHQVCVANDGPRALERAGDFQPKVVFLDIGLPGMDGYEVARRLRRVPGLEQVMLVALTGWGTENDRILSQEAGFNEHLTKPTNLGAIEKLLGQVAGGGLGADHPVGLRGRQPVEAFPAPLQQHARVA